MARASAKRGRRPRSNARSSGQPVASPPAAPVEEEAAQTKSQPPEQPEHQEKPERRRAERKPKAPPRPEDQMFFMRLRTHAKWVFVVLAAAFAIGFLAFGVGAGGTGFGDAIADFFGGGDTEAPSIQDAQEAVEENPNDPEAVLDLANAYQADRQYAKAAESLERYLELRPDDVDALRQLAVVYTFQTDLLARRQNQALTAATLGTFGGRVYQFPDSNGFLGALGEDPIDQALAQRAQIEAQDLQEQVEAAYAKQADTFEKLSTLAPDDPTVFLQLGQAAANARDNERAIAAFERFLELAPDDPQADDVREQLELLREDINVVTG